MLHFFLFLLNSNRKTINLESQLVITKWDLILTVPSVNGKQFFKQCLTDDLQQEHWRQSLEERGPYNFEGFSKGFRGRERENWLCRIIHVIYFLHSHMFFSLQCLDSSVSLLSNFQALSVLNTEVSKRTLLFEWNEINNVPNKNVTIIS